MSAALIGCTGFVGGHLVRTERFDDLVHRPNLDSLAHRHFDRIVCAGLPAAKWLANKDPQADLENLQRLESVLRTVSADRFVLISTIDVYPCTADADEDFACGSRPNHAYGSHRLRFEEFVTAQFPVAHVVRLPALFGAGLKKNVIYDLLHDNQVERINPASRFQWYPVARLADDLRTIESRQLPLVNLFTEPVTTEKVIECRGRDQRIGTKPDPQAHYDLRTRHGRIFGGDDNYIMNAAAVLASLETYVGQELLERDYADTQAAAP